MTVPRPNPVITCYKNVPILGLNFPICKIKILGTSTLSSALAIYIAHMCSPIPGPWRAAHLYLKMNFSSKAGTFIYFCLLFSLITSLILIRLLPLSSSHITSSRTGPLCSVLFPFLSMSLLLTRDETWRSFWSQDRGDDHRETGL